MKESKCHVVVDSGFSFTYGVPFFNGVPLKQGSLRMNVGGKLLTNLLTEIISQKQFNLQGEFALVNHMKELSGFVASSGPELNSQLDLARKGCPKNSSADHKFKFQTLQREYVLPDFKKIKKGFLIDRNDPEAQKEKLKDMDPKDISVVNLTNERFVVPEVLFNPQDIGLTEGGIPEMVKQISQSRVPSSMEPLMLENIVLAGGNSLYPGIAERLQWELEERGYRN
eukprot:CAMPEP_0170512532 /NCGR_PEP_ID=MMETSP0208-20121228/66903_1 /TAXON_ID=197538 /ORGANISM="Strombidium inclinatum, Strain S3" /LENGTH=225 /DNA_ID=CAMNT_0010796173 /DNA_START=576 /DNA_END=1253 /DNA_ORIENTATION=-